MAMQITQCARQQHDTIEDAERMIEVYGPARYIYQIVPIHTRLPQVTPTFAVKVFSADGPFLGYAWIPEE